MTADEITVWISQSLAWQSAEWIAAQQVGFWRQRIEGAPNFGQIAGRGHDPALAMVTASANNLVLGTGLEPQLRARGLSSEAVQRQLYDPLRCRNAIMELGRSQSPYSREALAILCAQHVLWAPGDISDEVLRSCERVAPSASRMAREMGQVVRSVDYAGYGGCWQAMIFILKKLGLEGRAGISDVLGKTYFGGRFVRL